MPKRQPKKKPSVVYVLESNRRDEPAHFVLRGDDPFETSRAARQFVRRLPPHERCVAEIVSAWRPTGAHPYRVFWADLQEILQGELKALRLQKAGECSCPTNLCDHRAYRQAVEIGCYAPLVSLPPTMDSLPAFR